MTTKTLWDPATSDVAVTAPWVITGDGATATINESRPGTQRRMLYADLYRTSGKRYFEIDTDDYSATSVQVGKMGIAKAGFSDWWASYYSGAVGPSDGAEYPPPHALAGFNPDWTNPCTIRFAVDFDAGKMWIGRDALWCGALLNPGDPDYADPAAGIHPGYSDVTGPATPFVRYWADIMRNHGVVLRSRTVDMVQAIPDGFVAWAEPVVESLVYPSALPGVVSAPISSAERRALSAGGANPEARVLQRDRLATQDITLAPMTADESAIFEAWGLHQLGRWAAWFAAPWPLPSGQVPGVRRFLRPPTRQFIAGGFWSYSGPTEVRGRAVSPSREVA